MTQHTTGFDHAQEQLLRATLDALPDAVIIVDGEGRIVAANAQVRAIFGYLPTELEGEPIELLVPPRVRAGHPQRRGGYTHRPMGLLQLAGVRKDGVEFPAEISLAPIAAPGLSLTAATVRDITDRLALEAESERMRDELLATVTHELRTPLTSIIGYAEVMTDLPDSELSSRGRRLLAAISRNADRELRLVSDLLFLAVGNLEPMRLDLAPVDVETLILDTVSGHRIQALNDGVELLAPGSAAPGAPVTPGASTRLALEAGDFGRLLQVLDNVVGNAIKFTPSGGSVSVSARVLDDSVVISVVDTGVGIEPAEQRRVFERLYRASNATDSVVPGAGLGLAITAEIVQAHHGKISLTSTPGTGTTVTIQLPRFTALFDDDRPGVPDRG